MNRINNHSILTFILCFLCLGCYEDKTGCLDVNSSNYDVTADEACEDCCVFPALSIEVTHRLNGESFSLGDTITNNLGEQCILESFHYYLSEFQLQKSGTSQLVNLDSLEIVDFNEEALKVEDNYALVSKSVFSKEIHDFSNVGSFDQISFSWGIPEEVNHSLELDLPSGHPLATSADSLYLDPDQGYVFGRARIIRGAEFLDTIILAVAGDQYFRSIEISLDSLVLRGTDFDIPLLVEYSCWFDDMNFSGGTEAELLDQFTANILCDISLN